MRGAHSAPVEATNATPRRLLKRAAATVPSNADPQALPATVMTLPVAASSRRTRQLLNSAMYASPLLANETAWGLLSLASSAVPSLLPGVPGTPAIVEVMDSTSGGERRGRRVG